MDQNESRLRPFARLSGVILAGGGTLVLVGWLLDVPLLKNISPSLVAMNPATAVLFICTAVCLALPERRFTAIQQILASLIVLVGGWVLLGFAFDVSLRPDQVLFADSLHDNRMAPNTAMHFVFIGLSLLCLTTRWRSTWPSQVPPVIVLAGSMMSLLGYGYGANNLYGVGSYIPMALHTALLLTVAATALLFAGGEHGVLAILSERGSGSVMARRLLPAAVIIPCLLGFARMLGQRAGWYDSEFGTALMVVVIVALLVCAVVFTAGALNRADAERQQAADALRRSSEQIQLLNESLEARVAERTAELAEANRDLAQKNQENEMFVYSVSHDLRSPLVNLQGFSKELDAVAMDVKTLLGKDGVPDAVRKEATALLDGDVKQALHFIQTAVGRLGSIIEALLRLSRVGRVEYQSAPIDMNGLVTRVVESMNAALYDAGVVVHIEDLRPCFGDTTALEQLFGNLIGNAVKYRDPERETIIEVGMADGQEGGRVQMYFVRDNGLGIPTSHQEKIFQAFKRAHPHVASGEGMGLAIVRRIAQRHGGAISVESKEGHGSTFVVTLPAAASVPSVKSQSPLMKKGEPEHGSRTHGDLVGGRR